MSALRLITEVLGSEDQAQRVLTALDAAGLVVVPRIPTAEMIEAAWAPSHNEDAAETWISMISLIEKDK